MKSWIDGELGAERSSDVGRHVRSCLRCSAVVRDYRTISERLRVLGEEPAPSVPIAAVHERAARREREEAGIVRLLQRVSAVAAAVLFISLGTLWSPAVNPGDDVEVAKGDVWEDVLEIVLGGGQAWAEEDF